MLTLRTTLRKAVVLISVGTVAAFGVAACGSDDEGGGSGGSGGGGGGEINITMTSFPDYIDPQLSYTVEGWETLYNVYTPLLTYKHAKGEDGTEVVPALAEALPEVSPDGLTYKLKMRSDMLYSDGTPIKASDFTYAIQRLFKADSGGSVFFNGIVGAPEYADGSADTISGIVTDDATGDITITLDGPNGTFENVLGLMFAAPVPPSTPLSDDATNSPPPSSGPFMITNVEAPQTLTLERNPNFKTVQDAGATEVADAGVDKITVTQNKSNTAQVTGVEQNSIDFMVDPPDADRLQEVKSRFADRFRMEESINTFYFWMNNQTAPFNDVRVRQAVNYAIDPEALNRVFGGRLHATQQILPPGMPGYEEYKLYPGPDMDKAKALLAEANPSDMDITVWTNDEPDRKRIGEYYHDVLNQLGFNATLKVLAGDVYFTTIGNQSTPDLDTGFGNWFQDFPHPDDFFRPLLNTDAILPTNGNNFSRASLPELDAKMNELRSKQLTDDGVEQGYAELDKAYMEQAVWAPYGNEQYTTFVSDRIDFDKAYSHLLFNQDWSALTLK
ncbi:MULTISPECIES: ABC transporter substrate-binding protein [Mycolicibacterium]|jgi:peptide/nickel transport system substrate-binding protein|uniref:Extracellular solute-binding protein n=2 Tax=Mycolicibacterium TaxID=1866885 RepID=A0A378THX8_9MYCO|nr:MULTISPECIES: ABC transporter substrate-binding protein [Mycolicibacterium]ANW66698.1 ABC transporter substrate-binding protein [Mycobacterium sp. djl-10]MCV7185140.1 ABC transporter substrate-binding protein [Mycolicibacterium murale]STZ60359.1 extracellular solute-binding protein [Mycolicibacterium tokaiense]BBY85132.1 ABC transporter substrate-binding protein [Mycolicibacterium tokaiense]GFG57265.1 ABC transporter substrate-binding protein [Mycolicibacterium murale]